MKKHTEARLEDAIVAELCDARRLRSGRLPQGPAAGAL
jgi:hypothetical protein